MSLGNAYRGSARRNKPIQRVWLRSKMGLRLFPAHDNSILNDISSAIPLFFAAPNLSSSSLVESVAADQPAALIVRHDHPLRRLAGADLLRREREKCTRLGCCRRAGMAPPVATTEH